MVEKGWAAGNMGRTVTREKNGSRGQKSSVMGVWMGDKTTGRYKILPGEKVLAERRGEEERPVKETAMGAQCGEERGVVGAPRRQEKRDEEKKHHDGK